MDDELTRENEAATTTKYLVVQRGAARLEVVDLIPGTRLTVGRSPTNRIVVPDPKCSRHHCEIYGREDRWFVRDLDSRNGVVVDGKRIDGDWELDLGQTVALGTCDIVYTDRHPDDGSAIEPVEQDDPYAIIERKGGTKYDRPLRSSRETSGAAELFQLAREMNASVDTAALADCVLDGLIRGTQAQVGGVLLFPSSAGGDDAGALRLMAIRGSTADGSPVFSRFLSNRVLEDREALLAHDLNEHSSLMARDSINRLSAQSAICAPIRQGNVVQGLIHLYTTDAVQPLDAECLEFTLAVADQAASVLDSIRSREQLAVGLSRAENLAHDLQGQLEVETELVGRSPGLDKVRHAIGRVAPTDATILIRGESGVGKELVARALHYNSPRREGPFVCVNCAALTESLLESELFGHEKGAFTGAAGQKAGKFEQANHGTLFLDEIGEMSPDIQAKFLRVLEGSTFERVGGGKQVNVDVRVVAATNRDLEVAVRENQFRQDLFFRLQVIEMTVPPLREHPDDIPQIVQHFVERFSRKSRVRVKGFNREAMAILLRHPWPGNVRELRNVVERAVILSDREILTPEDIVLSQVNPVSSSPSAPLVKETPPPISRDPMAERPTEPGHRRPPAPSAPAAQASVLPAPDPFAVLAAEGATLDDVDQRYLEAVLEHCGWNKSNAARVLGIERTTLDRRLKRYGLERPPRELG